MQLKKSQDFLLKLSRHNNREWFHDNKGFYQEARAEFLDFAEGLIEGMKTFTEMGDIRAKECMYRIQRDIRFSPNKTPYNTHFSLMLSPEGRKTRLAPYYFRLKPDEHSLVAGGVWEGKAAMINMIRQEIDYGLEEFVGIIEAPEFIKYFGQMQGQSLKRIPRGYEEDHPRLDLIKKKQFLLFHYFEANDCLKPDFQQMVLERLQAMKPFLDFLNVPLREYWGDQ